MFLSISTDFILLFENIFSAEHIQSSSIELPIHQEMLKSHSFFDVTKFRNAGLPTGSESNELNLFSRIRGIVTQGLENLFIA